MLLAAVGSTGYDIVKTLHIFAAIMGFGGVALNGIYARVALEEQGPAGGAVARAANKAASLAEIFIYLVPVLGIGLVAMSDGAWEFEDPWVSISIVLYLVALGVSFGVLRPGAKRFEAAVADPGEGAEAARLGKTLAIAGGVANLLWVVILFLMVFKPS